MRILFSNSPWWLQASDARGCQHLRRGIRAGSRWPFSRVAEFTPDNWQYGGYLPMPFFLSSAAAYCAEKFPDASVWLRDSIARGESYEAFFKHIEDEAPDWIVMESATPCLQHDLGVIREIKLLLPATKIILTGTIVADRDFKKPDYIYAAVRGEYEKGVATVIGGMGHEGINHFDFLTKDEMNALPVPMFDEVAEGRYWDACPVMPAALGRQWPHIQLMTSRGCYHRCVFCAWPATMTGDDPDGTKTRTVRFHTPEWIESVLENMIWRGRCKSIEYKSVYLDDDFLNINDRHTLNVCAVMKRIGLPWSAMCRADSIKPETWKAMRESGCFGVKVGIESGSDRVVNQIVNKKLNIAEVESKWLPLLKELGFVVHTTWTEGLPGETPEERKATHAMIARLYAKGLHRTHQLSGTAEISGTPLHTLRMKGDLAKYPGAHVGAGYEVSHDGQVKVEAMERK